MTASRKSHYTLANGKKISTTDYSLYKSVLRQGAKWQHWADFCLFLDKNAPRDHHEMLLVKRNPNALHSDENSIFVPKTLKHWLKAVDGYHNLPEHMKSAARSQIIDVGRNFHLRATALSNNQRQFIEQRIEFIA